jgi:hypothetical protein
MRSTDECMRISLLGDPRSVALSTWTYKIQSMPTTGKEENKTIDLGATRTYRDLTKNTTIR